MSSSEESPLATPVVAPPRSRGGCWLAFLGTALILAGLAGFVFYRLETFPRRVREAFASIAGMQPRVTVNEQVIYEQTHPVLELAVLEREMVVERDTTNRWLGSTKHLRVRGVYRVKAGFDLTRPVTVNLDRGWSQTVHVQLTPARILSTELLKLDVLSYDNGLWNHVKPEEFTDEVQALNVDARLKAGAAGMMTEAKRTFTAQLQERIGADHHVDVVTTPSVVPLQK